MKNMAERFDDLYETHLGGDINYLPMELSSSNSSCALDKYDLFCQKTRLCDNQPFVKNLLCLTTTMLH
jgi:hypothetical protein